MKKLMTMIAVTVGVSFGMALPAAADRGLGAPPAGAGAYGPPPGIACQQAGISTLMDLGLLAEVARDGIVVVELGEDPVPFETVLSLHRTTPSAFQPGGVTVVVPGVGNVPATWCDNV